MPTYPYERPSVTVDVVLVSPQNQVLLIRRAHAPFEGFWALPGGFVEPEEPLESAARRELLEETGAQPAQMEQLYTFGDPGRDPRGWTISVAYLAWSSAEDEQNWRPVAASDAADARWFDLEDLPPLAFDHDQIIARAKARLRERDMGL